MGNHYGSPFRETMITQVLNNTTCICYRTSLFRPCLLKKNNPAGPLAARTSTAGGLLSLLPALRDLGSASLAPSASA